MANYSTVNPMHNFEPPDYVNGLPKGYPPDTPRCEYVFEHDFIYKGYTVRAQPCGLAVPNDDIGKKEGLCYFHSERSRKGDKRLKEELETAVGSRAYLGGA